jgi:catechol 2,3-dioxygenase-like lactoylglutathione lyase family enzyme
MGPQSKRPGVRAVHSVQHFVLTVPDLGEAQRFYAAFGLDVRREDGCLRLYAFGHPHAWASLHEAPGPKRLLYLSLGIYAEDEAAFAEELRQRGLACAPHRLSQGDGQWLRGPDGVPLQLVVAPKVSPSVKSRPVQAVVAPGAGAAPARSRAQPVQPRHLSHLLLFTTDVPAAVRFYMEVLGLRLSDHSGDGIAFLHGAHGSDHHLIALAKSAGPGLHHSSWDVGSLHEVGLGGERMKAAGYRRGWGVGRHVLGSNYFYYVRDPWGSWAEYSFDIDFVPSDLNWQAADHPPEDAFYVWGPTPPEDFVVNTELAPAA